MYRMARRLPSMARQLPHMARASLPSLSPIHSRSTSTESILSKGLNRLAEHQPAPVPRAPSLRQQQGLESNSGDSTDNVDSGVPTGTGHLNVSESVCDDGRFSFGQTIFSRPGATKLAVLDALKQQEVPLDKGFAFVVFASPRHASWLTDMVFMAKVVKKLYNAGPGADRMIHVLAAVVDGLYPTSLGREMQEGLSIQFGSLDQLVPGLWDEASHETPETQNRFREPGYESAHVSMVLRKSAHRRETYTVNLPLANTLFHNGRRTTLLALQWLADTQVNQTPTLMRMLEKRCQNINLPISIPNEDQYIHMCCPLVPITHPRKIVEGLGNILAKVDIEGELSPASKELQVNIPRLLQARQSQSDYDPVSARIGVWALIIPERLVGADKAQRPTPLWRMKKAPLTFITNTRAGHLGTATGKLAFEMDNALERTAWQRSTVMGDILLQGGRLHQILSGGGEWGAKASLLSLDPESTYGAQSEDEELDRFQRSFHGDDATEGATTRPGDYVQFFVEDDSFGKAKQLSATRPRLAFGVGEFSKEDYAPENVDASMCEQRSLVRLAPHHFGAFSADGLYLDMRCDHAGGTTTTTTTTKVNTPGTIIRILPSETGKSGDS